MSLHVTVMSLHVTVKSSHVTVRSLHVTVMSLHVTVKPTFFDTLDQAWELSAKTQISAAVKLTFRGEKKCPRGKETGERKKGSTGSGSSPNTRETYGARSHAAVARLGRVINREHNLGLATGLNKTAETTSKPQTVACLQA